MLEPNLIIIVVVGVISIISITLIRISFGGENVKNNVAKALQEVSTWLLAVSVALGILLVVLAYGEIVGDRDMPARQYQVIRMMIAFGAGFISAGITGSIEIEVGLGSLIIKAGGPFATVVMFYMVDPSLE